MLQELTAEELFDLQNALLIDVRSEKEFYDGTIPNAINIPIFTNEERAEIGKVYTRESTKKAMEIGLEVASKKLPSIYKEVVNLAGKKKIVLFCWRGGLRSKSLTTVLDLMGLPVFRLTGGYKAYRRIVFEFFEQEFPFHLIVLRGNTGTGKTELLHKLKDKGYPVIDLEQLSNNRGSVFGDIGLGVQPSQKQFEANLFHEIKGYHNFSYLIVECESKRVGKVTLPDSLYRAMHSGTQVLIYDTLDHRSERLVQEYTQISESAESLKNSLEKLKARLGKTNLQELFTLLEQEKYKVFAEKLIVEYYDKLYGYPNEDSDDYNHCILNESENYAIDKLENILSQL